MEAGKTYQQGEVYDEGEGGGAVHWQLGNAQFQVRWCVCVCVWWWWCVLHARTCKVEKKRRKKVERRQKSKKKGRRHLGNWGM